MSSLTVNVSLIGMFREGGGGGSSQTKYYSILTYTVSIDFKSFVFVLIFSACNELRICYSYRWIGILIVTISNIGIEETFVNPVVYSWVMNELILLSWLNSAEENKTGWAHYILNLQKEDLRWEDRHFMSKNSHALIFEKWTLMLK